MVNYIGIASGVNWTTHEHLLCGHRPQYHRQPHQLGQLTITKTNTLAPVIIGWALASLSLHCAGNRENRISVANVQNYCRAGAYSTHTWCIYILLYEMVNGGNVQRKQESVWLVCKVMVALWSH